MRPFDWGLVFGMALGTMIGRALWDIGGYLIKRYRDRKNRKH